MDVTLRDVEVRYGRQVALEGVSLELKEGVWGLLGPNGAGKSTLMKVLATLLVADRGSVQVGPFRLPRQQHEVRRRLGYLPQEFGLPGNVSGREYLRYAAAMKGASSAEVDRLLEVVGLREVAGRPLRSYSGGMKQRVGIAQALLGEPDLLLVDEPTADLDPEQRTRLRMVLAQHRPGRTVLFSTHVVSDLEQVADRIVVLHRGRVRFVGTLEELAAQGRGWVWTLTDVPEAAHPVGGTVLSERLTDGRFVRRLFARRQPHPDAVAAAPTVEEGYLSVIARADAATASAGQKGRK